MGPRESQVTWDGGGPFLFPVNSALAGCFLCSGSARGALFSRCNVCMSLLAGACLVLLFYLTDSNDGG